MFCQRVLVHHAALHDEADVFHLADVGERVAAHGDDVGVLAGGDGADVLGAAEQVGGVGGGGAQGQRGSSTNSG